jgi:hypothetical protein
LIAIAAIGPAVNVTVALDKAKRNPENAGFRFARCGLQLAARQTQGIWLLSRSSTASHAGTAGIQVLRVDPDALSTRVPTLHAGMTKPPGGTHSLDDVKHNPGNPDPLRSIIQATASY